MRKRGLNFLGPSLSPYSFILKSAEAATSEDWDAVFGSNVKGCGLTSKYAIKAMRAAGRGGAAAGGDASRGRPTKAIVNLGSISSFIGQADLCTYSTTKAAILALTRCVCNGLAGWRQEREGRH